VFDIIVIGGMNVDIKAKVTRAPIAGTSNPGTISFTPGGVARNIAHNLGSLGVNVALISVAGNDPPGEMALAASRAAGVDLSMVLRTATPTGSYVAMLDERGELSSAVNDMRILEELTSAHVQQYVAALERAKFVVVDCNVQADLMAFLALKFSDKLVVEPVSVAKSEKLKALLDRYEVFFATPNRDQLVAMTDNGDVEAACRDLHERGLQNLVVHLGAAGSLVSTAAGVRQLAVDGNTCVTDVTGAGDAAVAGLLYGLSQGFDIPTAAEFGQAAASLKVHSNLSIAAELSEDALKGIVKARYE
jgi:pseudouridine kinase